ncbi:MAG: carboxypeptidase regulatory-like domain-containing protein [Terracidiphilus sp.]
MQIIEPMQHTTRQRQGAKTLLARWAWWPSALLLLLLVALPASAQYRASLQGTVVDAQGAMIPGAQLTLTDKEINRSVIAHSDGQGNFSFNELKPSQYTLVVTRDGFKKKVFDNLSILAEQANGLTVKLEVGAVAETVSVNAAEAPVMDTETGSISGTIDQNDIAKMPDFGRDPLQLAQLAPGMFGDSSQNAGGGTYGLPGNQGDGSAGATSGPYMTENKPQVFGNGQRNDTNGISLDGVQITSVTWGSAAVVTPNPDSIKEIKVVTNGYDAEYGRFGGAQIQLISQNGTNQYHGTALFKVDRPGLNAYQRWDPNNNKQRDNARYNEYGGTVGGPIPIPMAMLKNKVFGFFSYDTIRNNGTVTGGGWYDTASFDHGSASGSIANKFLTIKGAGAVYTKVLEAPSDGHDCADIGLIQGKNCNYIQGQGLDIGSPTSYKAGYMDPTYAAPYYDPATKQEVYTPGLGNGLDGNADLMYLATKGPNNNINTQYGGRLDFQATQKDLIAASVFYVPVNNTSYNGPNRDYNYFHHNAENYSLGLLWNHTISSSMVNEARGDMAGWRWNELGGNSQSPLGLPDAQIMQANWAGSSFSNMTPASFGPSIGSWFDQWTLNFKDVFTKVYKSHNLKFGGQVTRLAYLDAPTWDSEPTYTFNNLWDFLNDAPNGENVTADPRTGQPSYFRKDDRQNIVAFFAQDDWKVRPNLTLNFGLRWEYFQGMTEKNGHEPNVRLGVGANTLTDLNIVLGGNQVNAQKGNFGPQIGFAWSPVKYQYKAVVRGGFGVAYNGLEQAITTNTRNNPPYLANGGWVTGTNIVYGTASNLYQAGALPANPNLITKFNSANLPINGLPTSVTGLPKDFPTAVTYHYSLEVQYDLGHQWVATMGYQGSLGRHLPLQTNLNNYYARQILTGQMAFNPIVNGIDWYYDGGNSMNNALLLEARHQFSHTFEADAQYRWGKSLDNGSGPYTSSFYEWMPGFDHGPSDFDTKHMIKVFGNWSPVIFHGDKAWMEKIAGGWNFSPIFNYHSGFPFSPQYGNGIGCSAFYSGSCGNGGNGSLLPVSYLGGASRGQNTDTFKQTNGPFIGGGSLYYTKPAVTPGNSWNTASAPVPVALPQAPGVRRNSFYGPHYSDLDLAMTKSFGLPNMKVLGENARLEFRANAFNLFNKLNLANIDSTVTDDHFGRANNVLGSRTVEMEAHFKF